MTGLPAGWCQAPLEEIITFSIGGLWGSAPGTASSDSTTVAVIRGADYRDWATKRAANAAVRSVSTKAARTRLLEQGNLVVEVSGGGPTQPVGRVVIIDDAALNSNQLPLILSNFCRRIVVNHEILPHFIYYQLLHKYACGETERFQTATTNIRNLNFGKYTAETIIKLAPRREQDRIIAAVEEQFSRLDAGVVALERARENLTRMRAAVLQAAVTDALKCTDQVMTSLADLLSAPLANGKSVPDGPANGFPVLRLTAVRDGWIDVTCSKKGAWTADKARPYIIRKGDYLVVRGNGSKHLVGRGAMVGVDSDVAYPDTLIRLRFDETAVVPAYAALIWNSMLVRNQIEGAARTTAGIYKVNQKDLGRVAFPVPSIEDQLRIHASADSALYAIGVLEAQVNVQLQRSDMLRSSILAAAFSGKLVAQDVSDEPARVLLARIAEEEMKSDGPKPRRSPAHPRLLKKATV